MGERVSRMVQQMGLTFVAAGGALSGLSCGSADVAGPGTGSIEVTTVTSGPEADANGYAITIDGGAEAGLAANATIQRADLEPGDHNVRLKGIAGNCTVAGENPRSITVSAGATTTVTFQLSCTATTGTLQITTATSGPAPDPDGYTITLDGADRGTLGASGAASIDGLTPGTHAVGLGGIAANCQVQGDNPGTVTVTAGASSTVALAITCAAPPPVTGTLRITTTTTGDNLDPDGYTFVVDGGTGVTSQTIGASATATVANVAAGEHTVLLSGPAANCTVEGLNPRPVTVAADAATVVSFAVLCTVIAGQYRAIDLGTIGGGVESYAYEINDAGQVVGYGHVGGAEYRAFMWQDGVMTDLGTLGGASSLGFGINAAGQVVGRSHTSGGEEHAFLWQGGTMTDLGSLGSYATAGAINVAGQVVGGTQSGGEFHAFLYDGVMQDLGSLGGPVSEAIDINASGQVVGYATNAAGQFQAFSWQNGIMTSLGTLGGDESLALGINASGQIVGRSEILGGAIHAFLWQNGAMSDLGGPSEAYAINAHGQIAGARFKTAAHRQAVFWENGVMTDLPTLGGDGDNIASGINDAGQIVGWSLTTDGATHATLWSRE